MSDRLRVVSLNIEAQKHYHRFPRPVREFAPHVVLFQEVRHCDIASIERMLGMRCVRYTPMAYRVIVSDDTLWGLASFVSSDISVTASFASQYAGSAGIPSTSAECVCENRLLEVLGVALGDTEFTLLHTHFTWSPDGLPTDEQMRDVKELSRLFTQHDSFALFGDLNVPRGRNFIWGVIGEGLVDNIPVHTTTTLDPVLHRVGDRPRIVDACFTAGDYHAISVELVRGLSDHQGVFAEIVRQIARQ